MFKCEIGVLFYVFARMYRCFCFVFNFIIRVNYLLLFCKFYCFLNREQTYDVLFEGDDEGKSIATIILDAIVNVSLNWGLSSRSANFFRSQSEVF